MRIKATFAYDGAGYSGWQIQEKPNPPATIQGAVESALFTLLNTKIRVFGAGRTDAGVHALGQVAHFDVPAREWDWRARLNAVLPADIRVLEAIPCAAGFHARKDATSKTYSYQFWQEPSFVAPTMRNYVWPCNPLDLAAMRKCLIALHGEHDFASFQNSGTHVDSTRRIIYDVTLNQVHLPEYPACRPIVRLEITGNGFLKQMVRNLAGFLAAIGKRKLVWQDLGHILQAKNRAALPSATAPAKGLFLTKVNYANK